jgi:hypothetical protein
MIWIVHPGSGSGLFTHPGSRIQGSKRHRIPDPQHCCKFSEKYQKNRIKIQRQLRTFKQNIDRILYFTGHYETLKFKNGKKTDRRDRIQVYQKEIIFYNWPTYRHISLNYLLPGTEFMTKYLFSAFLALKSIRSKLEKI